MSFKFILYIDNNSSFIISNYSSTFHLIRIFLVAQNSTLSQRWAAGNLNDFYVLSHDEISRFRYEKCITYEMIFFVIVH